jgi:3-oxoacyl-[acyl-carrier protein] reductase
MVLTTVAIVTGGGRGLGKATCLEFAKKGAAVVVADADYNNAREVAEAIKDGGGMAMAIPVDVTDRLSVKLMVEAVIESYGHIDVLVNNAGITRDSSFLKMTDEQWDKVMDVNLNGVYNCTKYVVPHMVKQEYGRIINISSIVGIDGNFGQTNYSATKAALIGFTKSLAIEVAKKGITVNAVAPGFIRTEMVEAMPEEVIKAKENMIPMRKLGKPEHIAKTNLFLASKDAEYITGAVIEVNGGL